MTAPATDMAFISAADASRLFRSGELSPVELTTALLERIDRLNPALRAFFTVTAESALAEAKAAEAAILNGDTRPLLGVPMAYKDIYLTKGIETTGGSKLHLRWKPDTTATTIRLLQEAGTVMLGKLTTHEFAAGITPEDHPHPPARNPWNPGRIPGGSSSGSGAALAAGLTVGALGSDTGGSIRHPGTACGIAALKPTYGRCSRHGVLPLSWSLDHTGPMARTVEDLALMLQVLAAYDPLDPASADVPAPDYLSEMRRGVSGMRIGVMRSWYEDRTHPDVVAATDSAAAKLAELGAELVDIEVPGIELERVQGIIMSVEAYAYHKADLAERRDLYPESLRNRFLSGALYTGDEYVNALRAKAVLTASVRRVMDEAKLDLLLSPTRGKTALTFEEAYEDYGGAVSFTGLFNLTGQPAISIPCGFGSDAMPIGLQLAGRPFAEGTVLAAAHAYEQASDWHTRHPAL